MRKVISIITVCFLLASIITGCGALQKLGFQKNGNDELHPASSIVMNEDEAQKLTDKVPIHLYFAGDDNKLRLEVRYIQVAEAKKSVGNLASTIVKELINGPGTESKLKATIPAGTKLRAPVTVNAGVATVDLTKEFVDKHPGGKEAEQLTIYSIVNSLTEIKDIQKVKFLVNGKVSKEYKGNFQFDAAFPRSPSLIAKTAAVPTTAKPADQKDSKQKDTDKKMKENAKPEDKKQDTTKENTTDKSKDSKQKPTDNKETINPEVVDEDAEATYLEVLE
ncbi:MAG: GerMN domain-containing protein [Clostridia bacterium]|nr:GerMN domain-containing protein [Clostridia bacterium]